MSVLERAASAELVDDIVLGYGGTIDKHIGDAVMAVFGAPRAHDTDPLRAARAAMDIHEALTGLGEPASRPLQAHIGIASGEVVAGTLARADVQDYTVLGDSVNLAARLVAAARPGETLLSDSVQRALDGCILSDAAGEMRFKGIDAPLRVWRLRGIVGESVTASRSLFVGRKAELDQFRGIACACRDQGAGQIVYVRGEAGIGKTRLALHVTAELGPFFRHNWELNLTWGFAWVPLVLLLVRALTRTPTLLRGAALGVTCHQHAPDDAATLRAEVLALTRAMPVRDALGDFLFGLFSVARSLAGESDAIVGAVKLELKFSREQSSRGYAKKNDDGKARSDRQNRAPHIWQVRADDEPDDRGGETAAYDA